MLLADWKPSEAILAVERGVFHLADELPQIFTSAE